MVDLPKTFGLSSIADPVALLEGLFEHAPVALQIYGVDGYCLRVNRAFLALFGSEPPPEYNILQDEILARDDGITLVRRAFGGETVHAPPRWYDPRELRQVHVSGHRVGIETTFIPLRDADGRVQQVALCFEDVTSDLRRHDAMEALRASEAALVRSEERFRRLVEAGIIGIITADLAGNILDANGTFLELVGYTLEEVRSGEVHWVDMTPPEWRHLDVRAVEQIREAGVATPWEKEFIRKDGTRVPVLVGVAPLDGATEECACFILDLTERKQAETALERLRQEREQDLRASIQVRDDFLAIAGHELKTPLAALLMQLQSLRRTARRDFATNAADRLDKAAASGLRLDRLINQLLDVSRITAGRLRLEPEAVNLADVVRDVIARYAGANEETNPPIEVSCAVEVTGYWDRLRLDQLINNLVGNAVKYGQGKPVEVDLHLENDEAVLRVVDHGIGIDEDHQRRIFQRFERAVTARDFTGFGLGLWITRHIVEASGGRIEVESTLGKGAAFTVRLPTHRSEASIEGCSVG